MIFSIEKGRHRSSFLPSFTFKNIISGQFSLLEISEINSEDTNKIIGLSDNWHHHKDSIRIGWRYYKNKVELMAYLYVDDKRIVEHLCYIDKKENIDFLLEIRSDEYVIWINEYTKKYKRESRWNFLRVILKPYFGGKDKAPKNIKLNLKWS